MLQGCFLTHFCPAQKAGAGLFPWYHYDILFSETDLKDLFFACLDGEESGRPRHTYPPAVQRLHVSGSWKMF